MITFNKTKVIVTNLRLIYEKNEDFSFEYLFIANSGSPHKVIYHISLLLILKRIAITL